MPLTNLFSFTDSNSMDNKEGLNRRAAGGEKSFDFWQKTGELTRQNEQTHVMVNEPQAVSSKTLFSFCEFFLRNHFKTPSPLTV